MLLRETIKVIEYELKRIYDDNNGFHYQECDPEGPSRASKNYAKYMLLKGELEVIKTIR